MILDIGIREIDGKLCLAKFAPKSPDLSVYSMDEDGYINFSIENFCWQKIIELKKCEFIEDVKQ